MFFFFAALYGVTFPKATDPAYASYRLFESLGFAVGYNYSPYLCTYVKLYILAGGMGAAILSYYIIENWNRITNKKAAEEATKEPQKE